ncbi:TPA: DinI-like family protein, partial [Escherichia coli]
MRIEICIAKEKMTKMPKGSVPALQQEMSRRIRKRYDDVEVIVKSASNDGLTILRAVDKENAQKFI